MPRDPKYDILFEPVRIGPKTLRNRFYQVPHCTGFGVEKPWSQAAHREVKAEGGWAAVTTEYCTVSPDADETPFISARMWDEHDRRHLALVPAAAHRHGALAGIELSHSGAHGENCETRLPPPAPSQLPSDFSNRTPKEMERADIARITRDWARAAVAARDAGFDIVYVYGGHSYLLGQFLSPSYNRRDDEYGGSLRNRARIWLEVLEAVRDAVGDTCAIACRVAVSGAGGPGVELDEGIGFVRLADDLVDLWDIHIGSILEWSKDSGSSRFFREGWQLAFTEGVRDATAKPIVGVGRVTTPDVMVDIIRSGAWDLIGAARPNIADPFLPRKIEEGRLDDIRACIGCNICISKGDVRRHIGCTQNATAGEEHRRGWHPERFPPLAEPDRDVLVVGAGPAGMECAIVLGKRGARRVRLVDAADDIGGLVRWVPRLPGLAEWGRLLEWRRAQLAKLANVAVETGRRMTAADVLAAGADTVVVATGSEWSRDGTNGLTRGPLPGADAAAAHVLVPEQVMLEGKRPPGRRCVVYDCEGYFTGAGMAELLRGKGHEVDLVTPLETVAPVCDETLEGPMLRRRLHDLGIHLHADVTLNAVEPGAVRGETVYEEPWTLACDAVCLVTQRRSCDELYRSLAADPDGMAAAGIRAVLRIGDCVAPQLIADVIWDGHRLARELEWPDPSLPLPHLRERPGLEPDPVLGATGAVVG
jgi:dimethylamine/trimethylamine dehydrogenase